MLLGSPTDAQFFAAIHQLRLQVRDNGRERRQTTRHDASSRVLIAPFQEGCAPASTSYRLVPCLDLSRHGLCLQLTCKPHFQQLIVMLGGKPVVLLAEVANWTEIYHGGRLQYRVGCRFLRRVERPE